MYQPLPSITEDLTTLQDRLRRERDPKRKPRLHLVVLIKSGQVTSRGEAAAPLAVHRNTVAVWLRRYRDGGLEALVTYKEAGAPAGQQTLPPAVCAPLQARLATSPGFASSLEVQRWLRDACALEVPSHTLYGIVHYQRKATLKRPRPSHAKKTPRTWRMGVVNLIVLIALRDNRRARVDYVQTDSALRQRAQCP